MATTSDPIWYNDVTVIWRGGRALETWPSVDMTTPERVNAIVRFLFYTGVVLYLSTGRDERYVLYALAAIAIVSIAYRFHAKNKKWAGKDTYGNLPGSSVAADLTAYSDCQRPTVQNPFGNLLPTDPPDRKPACMYDAVKDEITDKFTRKGFQDLDNIYGKRNAERAFYTMPVTTWADDREAYLKFAFGDMPVRQPNLST
jgi:hypothetical protein